MDDDLARERASAYLDRAASTMAAIRKACLDDILAAAEILVACFRAGGALLICGNGGSAADAQHLATEFVSALTLDHPRPAMRAIALTTDTSALTAIANDFGAERMFARQVEALGRPGDVLLAISTSGNSPNVLAAAAAARSANLKVIALTGRVRRRPRAGRGPRDPGPLDDDRPRPGMPPRDRTTPILARRARAVSDALVIPPCTRYRLAVAPISGRPAGPPRCRVGPRGHHVEHMVPSPPSARLLGEPVQTTLGDAVLLTQASFVVVDLETTGGSPVDDAITEIGAVRYEGLERVGSFASLVDPRRPIPRSIAHLTGISDLLVAGAPTLPEILPTFLEFARGAVIVAHNASFDVSFLNAALLRLDYPTLPAPAVCTAKLARRLVWPDVPNVRLRTLAGYFRTRTTPIHRALADAEATGEVLQGLLDVGQHLGIHTLGDLYHACSARGRPNFAKIALAEELPRGPGVYLFRDRAVICCTWARPRTCAPA